MNGQASENTWRAKIGRMSREELEAFLATDVLCRLGCLDEDGWPYVVPVWFQYRDEGFYIVPRERSAGAEMLKRDPRVFLMIDRTAPQRRVLIKGHAELIEEPNVGGRWVAIAEEMSYRYLGEHGPDYLVPTLPISTGTIPTRTAPRTSACSRSSTATRMVSWGATCWSNATRHANPNVSRRTRRRSQNESSLFNARSPILCSSQTIELTLARSSARRKRVCVARWQPLLRLRRSFW